MATENPVNEYKGTNSCIYGYSVDTIAEMNAIVIPDDAAAQSYCMVSETKEVYLLSASRTWEVW